MFSSCRFSITVSNASRYSITSAVETLKGEAAQVDNSVSYRIDL